jgi:hypothetical protein
MAQDLFYSMLSRTDLVNRYSDTYKAVFGFRPTMVLPRGRAELCDMIEELQELMADGEEIFAQGR